MARTLVLPPGQGAILQRIADDPGIRLSELARERGVSVGATQSQVTALVAAGYLAPGGSRPGRRFRVTAAGRAALALRAESVEAVEVER